MKAHQCRNQLIFCNCSRGEHTKKETGHFMVGLPIKSQ